MEALNQFLLEADRRAMKDELWKWWGTLPVTMLLGLFVLLLVAINNHHDIANVKVYSLHQGQVALKDLKLYTEDERPTNFFKAWEQVKDKLTKDRLEIGDLRRVDQKFVTTKAFISGKPELLTRGLEAFLGFNRAQIGSMQQNPVEAIQLEIEDHGTPDDKYCLDYVLNKTSGTSTRKWPNGKMMDEDRDTPVTLDSLTDHEHAKAADLTKDEVLAARLYTTIIYKSLNEELRKRASMSKEQLMQNPYHFPMLIISLKSCVMKLRKLYLMPERGGDRPLDLFRGMRDIELSEEFKNNGGTELAPMSTTANLMVALQYASSERPLIMKVATEGFMNRGADISFLSAFPNEKEYLFPPLTFLKGQGETYELKGLTFYEAKPTLA
mmetsp:Transcript_5191/g.8712  ORF Transcript_5191/g.8712 Transcript_5191/m.8712 type:complete len:382 (-) Transcript_5191:441-1586(-)